MADLVVTSNRVALVDPDLAEVYDAEITGGVTIAAGDAVTIATATGKAIQGDGSAAGTTKRPSVAVKITGKAVSRLKKGRVWGFDLSSLNFGDPIYLSDTAGKFADAPGTVSVVVGSVGEVAESGNIQKVMHLDAAWR